MTPFRAEAVVAAPGIMAAWAGGMVAAGLDPSALTAGAGTVLTVLAGLLYEEYRHRRALRREAEARAEVARMVHTAVATDDRIQPAKQQRSEDADSARN